MWYLSVFLVNLVLAILLAAGICLAGYTLVDMLTSENTGIDGIGTALILVFAVWTVALTVFLITMLPQLQRMLGEDCHCHSNSALLWEVNKDKTVICTGYALSADGMWRQHSWLIHRKPRSNRVVETTEPRILYYGFAMTPELCEEFVNENVW